MSPTITGSPLAITLTCRLPVPQSSRYSCSYLFLGANCASADHALTLQKSASDIDSMIVRFSPPPPAPREKESLLGPRPGIVLSCNPKGGYMTRVEGEDEDDTTPDNSQSSASFLKAAPTTPPPVPEWLVQLPPHVKLGR